MGLGLRIRVKVAGCIHCLFLTGVYSAAFAALLIKLQQSVQLAPKFILSKYGL